MHSSESLPLRGPYASPWRWLPVAVLASTVAVMLLSLNAPGSSSVVKGQNGKGQTLEMLYTQINIMTPSDKSGIQTPQNANPVTSYMGGYSVPVPAGDNRKAFPYPLGKKQKKIDTSKWVLRSEADDRFKQMEKRMKADENAMARMQETIRKLKRVMTQ